MRNVFIPGNETCLKCLLNRFDLKVYKSEISPLTSHNGTKTDANFSVNFGLTTMVGDFLNFAIHFLRFSSLSRMVEQKCEFPR